MIFPESYGIVDAAFLDVPLHADYEQWGGNILSELKFSEVSMRKTNFLVGLTGALVFSFLAVMFSIHVFGISSGWMFYALVIACAILGGRAARAIYGKINKGE